MSVTLGWLLAQRSLALELISGPDPDSVEVRWAHAVELPDPTPWLEGGELVLTTGLRLPRSVAGQTSYVGRLADAGVSALGFGVGVEYADVPRTVRKACADRGLPLVVVPLPTPFLAVIRAVADHEAEQQRAALQDAVDFQQQLTRAALEHGVSGLVDALGRKLAAPVVVVEEHGRELAASGPDRAWPDLLAELRTAVGTAGPPARTLPTSQGGTRMVLRLGDARDGRGWLAVETIRAATSHERLLIGQVASILTLQLSRSADLSAAYAELGAAATDLALSGAGAAAPVLARLGLDAEAGVRVVAAVSVRSGEVAVHDLGRALDDLRLPGACTRAGDAAIALLSGDAGEETVADLLRVLTSAGRPDVVLGVSGVHPLERAPLALAEARRAATSARLTHTPVVAYGALELESLLDDERVRERVDALAGSGLSALLASDRPADRELARTLRAFLETNGSWESASRRLDIHRHTLRQRMTRIAADTGLDLDSAHTRAATLLVLLAHERSAH